ncbi:DgyrCDS12592 [Dimorphilus gyrociliatus]|uniref:DgyrCDS12592 n=1 Tax=Dimorphilus gyrociliatus TaxID=2664684 RepID=A0A7I8W6Y7_9ANNE|nr:DgyrCDS12592 [Dimorphilus gyrociliatus]
MERSLYSTRYIFVENSYREGDLSDLEFNILDEWYQQLAKDKRNDIDLHVYLQASPKVCYDRILKRDRSEENTISLSFIEKLHDLHEEWLITKKAEARDVMVRVFHNLL